jgi:rhamnosyltransferase
MTPHSKSIYAVVITYFPEDQHIKNILETAKQVDKVVVVDNGSGVEIENKLDQLTTINPNIEIIKLGDNLGIDKATNIGIKSQETNYDFVMTLDQDSVLGENMVKAMLDWYHNYENKEAVGEITPLIVNPTEVAPHGDGEYEIKDTVMASGRIIRTSMFKEIGYEDEWFFIDGVEWDFTYKLSLAGYKSFQINKARLNHNLGEQVMYRFFGKTIIYTSHNKLRKYYITRNYLYMFFKYGAKFPRTFWQVFIDQSKTELKMLIYDKERGVKIQYILWGFWDFLRGVKGKNLDI